MFFSSMSLKTGILILLWGGRCALPTIPPPSSPPPAFFSSHTCNTLLCMCVCVHVCFCMSHCVLKQVGIVILLLGGDADVASTKHRNISCIFLHAIDSPIFPRWASSSPWPKYACSGHGTIEFMACFGPQQLFAPQPPKISYDGFGYHMRCITT